jgi:hypothetical protein
MAAKPPRSWSSTFPSDTTASAGLNFRLVDDALTNRVLASQAFNYPNGKPLPSHLVPERIFPNVPGDPLKGRNWVRITGGLYVISEAFRNLLVDFDLGSTQIVEVPYVHPHGLPVAGRWFLFHISETRTCLVAEQSTGIKKHWANVAQWVPDWSTSELLAVTAASADGVDVWIDLSMKGRIFFSDRLKSAITAAGIRSRGMKFQRCLVVG